MQTCSHPLAAVLRRRLSFAAFSISALIAAVSAHAQNQNKTWDAGAGTSSWLDPLNWSGNTQPVTGTGNNGDNLIIASSAVNPVFTASEGSLNYRSLVVAGSAAQTASLTVTGGSLTTDNVATRIGNGAGANGTLSMSGGTVTLGNTLNVGASGGTGTVNLSGGTLTATRNNTINGVSAVSLALGDGASSNGVFNLTGGTLSTRTGILIGSSTGGTGTFSVGGAGIAQIGHNNASDSGFWLQRTTGTLKAIVDSSSYGLGSIDIFDVGNTSYVTFEKDSLLEVGFSGAAPTVSMSWNLLTFETGRTVTDGGLKLTGVDTTNWSFNFVDLNNGSSALQLTYSASVTTTPSPSAVPEPATYGLLGSAFLAGMMFYRRSRSAR